MTHCRPPTPLVPLRAVMRGVRAVRVTLLEIDYKTVVDDEDLVDEFFTFKNTLECM